MIRVKDIQNRLLSLVGWRQVYDTASDIAISERLTISESGLYFQDVHPLLTLENMNCIAPDFKNTQFPEYEPEKEYITGAVIKHEGVCYKALQNSAGSTPFVGSEDWEITNPFSIWLESMTKGSIQKAVMRYCNERLAIGTMKSLCENKTLFDGTGRIADTIKNKNNLVGFEIVPIRSKGVTLTINKLGIQFTEPGEYTFYLMHSSVSAPIQVIKVQKIRKNSIEWFPVNLNLPYQSADNDAGGSWYLCYYQSALPENSLAIRKDRDWSKGPCSTCSRVEYASWQAWSKYFEIHPFYINKELVPGADFNADFNNDFNADFNNDFTQQSISMWDIEKNMYCYDTNYGLNLDISISCDITDFIIEQRNLFVDVIAKQVAIDMLRDLAYNPNVRTNRHSINASRVDILYELDGDSASMKKSGLSYQLDLAFKALTVSLQGIDRVCQPCKNNGIKFKAI